MKNDNWLKFQSDEQKQSTLFSKGSAHENHPNFLRSLGHRPRPRVILILSVGLESNSQKTPCQNLKKNDIYSIHLRAAREPKGIFEWGLLHFAVKTNWHDPRSGSVTRGHRENWAKSMCTSFGEECKRQDKWLMKIKNQCHPKMIQSQTKVIDSPPPLQLISFFRWHWTFKVVP